MTDPHLVYQLALRLGVSYEATCRSLSRYEIITPDETNQLTSIEPKRIKQNLLDGYQLANWYPDVWLLTERDEGAEIEGGPNDVFMMRLRENSSAGYLWNIDQLKASGFAVVQDSSAIPTADLEVGGDIERRVTACSDHEISGQIEMIHARPWAPNSPMGRLSFFYDLLGRENGMSRVERRQIEAE